MKEDALLALRLLREEVDTLARAVPGTVSSVSLRVGEIEIEIAWDQPASTAAAPTAATTAVAPAPASRPALSSEPLSDIDDIDDDIRSVVAPLVGTFYIAPEPGAGPFVLPGDKVEPGQPIGIVEAMKLMNSIPSEWTGEVVEVMVKNGEPVEFGQELARIRVTDQ